MGTLGSIITWALFGLVIGVFSRAMYPGPQRLGVVGTMILGIVGSLVGGLISWLLGYDPQDGPLQGAGWIMSLIGALILIWGGLFAQREKA
jgi:uncharacterized membrane protein YeaQ/YmgE (transglycosylase-associated protein family)